MDIYKESGLRGRTYYIFDKNTDPETAAIEAARASKNARGVMEVYEVWIREDGQGFTDIFPNYRKGAVKMLAVTRAHRKS